MRTAPAVRVEVTRFGVWRAMLAGVLAATWLVVGGWVLSHAMALGRPPAPPVALAGLAALLLSAVLAGGLSRLEPFDLFWDGRCWFLTDPPRLLADPLAGDLDVAVDLGGWLLLRFTELDTVPRPRSRWLPVQRRGLQPAWHALRCAVYSPKPAPDAPVVPARD